MTAVDARLAELLGWRGGAKLVGVSGCGLPILNVVTTPSRRPPPGTYKAKTHGACVYLSAPLSSCYPPCRCRAVLCCAATEDPSAHDWDLRVLDPSTGALLASTVPSFSTANGAGGADPLTGKLQVGGRVGREGWEGGR